MSKIPTLKREECFNKCRTQKVSEHCWGKPEYYGCVREARKKYFRECWLSCDTFENSGAFVACEDKNWKKCYRKQGNKSDGCLEKSREICRNSVMMKIREFLEI